MFRILVILLGFSTGSYWSLLTKLEAWNTATIFCGITLSISFIIVAVKFMYEGISSYNFRP